MLFQTVLQHGRRTYWLGKLGKIEISAPTIAWPAIFLLISIGGGLAVAGLALVSQNLEQEERKRPTCSRAGYFHKLRRRCCSRSSRCDLLRSRFEASVFRQSCFPVTNIYMRTIFLGAPFTFTMFTFNSLFTAIGDTKTPMYFDGFLCNGECTYRS